MSWVEPITGCWEITIPDWRPATVNELFRSIRHRIALKRSDRDLVMAYARMARVPEATGKRCVSLRITLGPTNRRCDVDAFWKSTLDALKHAKMIRDDAVEWAEIGGIDYRSGARLETIIILEDLET